MTIFIILLVIVAISAIIGFTPILGKRAKGSDGGGYTYYYSGDSGSAGGHH